MECRGCSRRRMLVWALGTICFAGAQGAPAIAEDTTEVAQRQLRVALAGWEDAAREHRLDVSLHCHPRSATVYDQGFPGLDVPPSHVGMPAPSEPMLLEGVVQGGEAALLHQAPTPLLAWYRGPGGTWLRAGEASGPKLLARVRSAGGHEIELRPATPGWPRGYAPDLPTLEQDLAATLDLSALRAWLLAAESLRRWERASGGTQIRAMARPTGKDAGIAWGAVRTIELTVELDPTDRLLSLAIEVERVGVGPLLSVERGGALRIERGSLEGWRLPYPRAPLRDPNEVLASPAAIRAEPRAAPPSLAPEVGAVVLTGLAPSERLALVLRPRTAPTSRLLEMFVARRRG